MDDTDTKLASMLTDERLDRIEDVLDARLRGLTVLLEDLHKPQNMAACIRTLEAIGIQDVHVIEDDDPFVPNLKITQGCHKWVDIIRYTNPHEAVEALQAAGYRVLAAAPDAAVTIDELDFTEAAVLCFGNELEGLSQALMDRADETFRIPMHGFTRSFNISVTLGMCMHTAAIARRRALGRKGDLTEEARATLRSEWLRRGRKGSDEILAAMRRRNS